MKKGATHVDILPIISKVGFTLAEVLITLGIIGVVAAMTIPSLYNSMQKRVTVSKLQKTYSELANAAKLSLDTSGGALFTDEGSRRERFEKYLAPHLKLTPRKVTANELIYYQASGARETGLALIRGSSTQYYMPSGVSLLVDNSEVNGAAHAWITGISILIDINGYSNPPNRFGRDAFIMVLYSDGNISLTYSDDGEAGTVNRPREVLKDGPSSYNYQCNKKGRGMWCGALIQKDGWKISPDYPW